MKKLVASLLCLSTLLGCRTKLPPHILITRQVVGKYGIQMEKEGILMTSYGGEFMYDVAKIDVGFRVYQPMTIDQARVLFIKKVREFLALVNSDEAIRPYLHDYPFTDKNLYFTLTFFDENETFYTGKYVSYVATIGNGYIRYTKFHLPLFSGGEHEVYRETFEEAERIVDGLCPKTAINTEES